MVGWRKLHNRELFNLRHVTCIGEMRNMCKILVRRREGPLGRYRHRKKLNSVAWSASEVYRPSYRRLLAKLVPRIILKWILKKYGVRVLTGFN
jgi:hypothetical protein